MKVGTIEDNYFFQVGMVQAFINGNLEADKHVYRKQLHTVTRNMWYRIKKEMPAIVIPKATVYKDVREFKLEMGVLA